jgi:fructokinase
VPRIETVSTIGAGDTFNAGILFGLIHEDVYYDDLATLPEATWDKVVSYAIRFSSEVCQSYQNYVSNEFAQSVK